MTEFTTDQILEGITSAMKQGNMPAVAGLMRLLAVQDPGAARTVLTAIELLKEER